MNRSRASRAYRASRREFLRRGALAASALAAPAIVAGPLLGARAPSRRIGIALLGAGGRGSTLMREFARNDDARFVAVCDPFRDRREAAKSFLEERQGAGSVVAAADYRDVIERKDVDAVVCASCDHWHIPLAYAAARAGKDMYVEKPLGPSLVWAWKLRAAVQQAGSVFQYGTQQRSGKDFRYAVEAARNGYLGEIRHVDAWCIDGTRAKEWFAPESAKPEPVPEGFDYDLWLGPAPRRPYSAMRVHREGSFHNYDYSLGFIAGWGAHPLDIAQWGLRADDSGPIEVEGTGTVPSTGGLFTTVHGWDVSCRYESGATLRFLSDAPARPVVESYRKRWSDHGTTFFGSEGWLSVDRGGLEASDPCLLDIRFRASDERLRVSRGHDRDFLDCVARRGLPLSSLEAAIRSDTISHLSNIAVRTGRKIRWDPRGESILDDPAAALLLERPMRAPYVI